MSHQLEEAVVALVEANDAVRFLGKAIGEAMCRSYEAQTADGGRYTDWLKNAYEHAREDSDWGGTSFYYVNHDGDVESYLAEHCPHALEAHRLIQARKDARKRLGIAKRRVSVMGRALIRSRKEGASR